MLKLDKAAVREAMNPSVYPSGNQKLLERVRATILSKKSSLANVAREVHSDNVQFLHGMRIQHSSREAAVEHDSNFRGCSHPRRRPVPHQASLQRGPT